MKLTDWKLRNHPQVANLQDDESAALIGAARAKTVLLRNACVGLWFAYLAVMALACRYWFNITPFIGLVGWLFAAALLLIAVPLAWWIERTILIRSIRQMM